MNKTHTHAERIIIIIAVSIPPSSFSLFSVFSLPLFISSSSRIPRLSCCSVWYPLHVRLRSSSFLAQAFLSNCSNMSNAVFLSVINMQ